MEVGGAKAARTDPQGPPGVPYHQEYVRWADATRLTPPCHKHDPNRVTRDVSTVTYYAILRLDRSK